MAFPVSPQGLIIKTANLTEAGWTRNLNNIFPLLIPLEDFFRRLADTALDIAMLEDLPHILNNIYNLNSMSIDVGDSLAA